MRKTEQVTGWLRISAALALAIMAFAATLSLAQAARYDISASESSLRLKLFAGGLLSAFAYDHLLVADGLAGRIVYEPAAVSQSALQLTVSVATLVVDDPELRAEEGLDGELSAKNIAEITETMLSAEFLDAEQYPRVVVTAVEVSGDASLLNVALNIRIKQQERTLRVPTRIELENGRIRAAGELFLQQTDFGIEPYSALLGMMKVKDTIQVSFDIVGYAQ